MSMSAAATSQTIGTAAPTDGMAGNLAFLATTVMGFLGMEMGRSHVLRRHGKVRPHEWHSRDRMFDLSLERIPEVVCDACPIWGS